MIRDPTCTPHSQQTDYQFQLDVDVTKTGQNLFETNGKIIYEVRWINRHDIPVILLQINGSRAEQEASFYLRLNGHPNIVRTLGRVRNNSNSIMLLQERCPKPDLSEILREHEFKPTEEVLYKIFEQICDAMIFLVAKGIIHGDLACRNVLVFQSDPTEPKKNSVKLTDFGLSRDLVMSSSAHASKTIIPIRYAAPEVLQNPNGLKYSEKSDVYSMGNLIWEACSYGEIPYISIDNDDDVRQRVLNGERLPRPALCNDKLWAIINQCWNQNPKRRPNFQTLKESFRSNQQSIMNRTLGSPFVPLPPIARNSSHHSNLHVPSESFEHEHANEERPVSYDLPNRKTRPIPCQFCRNIFPSSVVLSGHLLLCGNKTEQCPTCGRFIRRAIFNYHTENNCTDPDETDSARNPTENRLVHISPENSSRKTSPTSTINTDTEENNNNRNTSSYRARPIIRIRTPMSNPRSSSITVESEDCHHRYVQNDYRAHQNNFRPNPVSFNNRNQHLQSLEPIRNPPRSLVNERDIRRIPVYIPCELCQRPIEKSNYSTHIQDCRERERRQVEEHARRMSQQPVIEPIPCEYCKMLYAGNQLSVHQRNCSRNPQNMISTGNLVQQRYHPLPPTRPIVPLKPEEIDSTASIYRPVPQSSILPPTRMVHFKEPINRTTACRKPLTPIQNLHFNNYTSNDPNHQSNRVHNDIGLNRDVTKHQYRRLRLTNNTPNPGSRNVSCNDFVYENETIVSREYRSYIRRTLIQRSKTTVTFDNQQEEFRSIRMRPNLPDNNFQNETHPSNRFPSAGKNRNFNSSNMGSNGLILRPNTGYDRFRRKKKHIKSRRRQSRRNRRRKQNYRLMRPPWEN